MAEVEPENLVPEQWKEVQAEINITKKERRKIAQQLEYGSRVEKNRKGYEPIRNVNVQEYLEFKEAKLAQLKPLVLDNPSSFPVEEEEEEEKIGEMNATESSSERVAPKNPRWAVYGRGLEDVTEFFNSGNYSPGENESSEGSEIFLMLVCWLKTEQYIADLNLHFTDGTAKIWTRVCIYVYYFRNK